METVVYLVRLNPCKPYQNFIKSAVVLNLLEQIETERIWINKDEFINRTRETVTGEFGDITVYMFCLFCLSLFLKSLQLQ